MPAIRVTLPQHLRLLAKTPGEVTVEVPSPVTLGGVLDAVEAAYPALGGTIRDYATGARRPLVRFFVCQEDWSHEAFGMELPAAIAEGREPFIILGAIAGG